MRTAFLSLAALASFAASAFAAPQGMDKVLKRNNDGKASSSKPSDVEILNYGELSAIH